MTNALHSSMLSEVWDLLEVITMPHVRLNARCSPAEDERFYNSLSERRGNFAAHGVVRCVEWDVSQCDKSQTAYNMLYFMHVMQQLGAPEEVVQLWSTVVRMKVASARSEKMKIGFESQVPSGFFGTIAVNTVTTATAAVVSARVRREEIVSFQARGDDGLLERAGFTDVVEASELFSTGFNFECKVFETEVPYFCSRYYVLYDGYYFLVKDPDKAIEALGRGVSPDLALAELHVSFADDMMHYEKKEVMDALDGCVVRRLETVSNRAALRGLSTLKLERQAFVEAFEKEVTVLYA